MLTEHDYPDAPAPRVQICTYRQANDSRPGRIYLQLGVERDFNPANLQRQRAAEERLSGGTDQVCGSIDNVATRHMQDLTGRRARIVEDGYAVSIEMDIPDATEGAAHTPASGAGTDAGPALTADQELVVPELVRSIETVLPLQERQHTETLALMVAKEIPSAADVISSSDRVTLAEVIAHHEHRMDRYTPMPVPASIRLAELSFPQHARAALHHSPDNTSAGPAGTARSHHVVPDLER
ncbi:hypothetical protein [Arthrobacter sp. HMWF013]|uniref:hypothetical protein n=1 Tax=Arthrobacter sp. HMWF013 TaxID=2056849 RepID=UPI000D39B7F0|nr:hypothetical protein [Arthrobacter sp. HMWF013]PTT69905.1 hypothetical protein DBR22_02500 [Arthrobacter sp. HMWF013]